MTRILLVDDDPIILRIYEHGLSQQGYHVETASSGLAAMKWLHTQHPDLVVLDLMMPALPGVEVLKFIRTTPALATVPAVVLSNSYMTDLSREAAQLGVHKALLKLSCSPAVLGNVIYEILEGNLPPLDPSELQAIPERTKPSAVCTSAPSIDEVKPAPARTAEPAPRVENLDPAFEARAREEFLAGASGTFDALRKLAEHFANATEPQDRELRLRDLYRKVHFVVATAGLARCEEIAQMASAFEALLFAAMDKPARLSPSVLRTIRMTVDFMGVLFERARGGSSGAALEARVLVIDDDPLSNRLVVSALLRARLQARSTDKPQLALELLQNGRYDLVLLDIEMPGMDGFELCKRLRALPGYGEIPVIYVTSHFDFESRFRGMMSGGTDVISKPVQPMELAVKAVMQLLRAHPGSPPKAGPPAAIRPSQRPAAP